MALIICSINKVHLNYHPLAFCPAIKSHSKNSFQGGFFFFFFFFTYIIRSVDSNPDSGEGRCRCASYCASSGGGGGDEIVIVDVLSNDDEVVVVVSSDGE